MNIDARQLAALLLERSEGKILFGIIPLAWWLMKTNIDTKERAELMQFFSDNSIYRTMVDLQTIKDGLKKIRLPENKIKKITDKLQEVINYAEKK